MAIRTSPAFDAELVGDTPDRIYQLPESIPPMMTGVVTNGVVTGLRTGPTTPDSMSSRIEDGKAYVDGAYIEVYGGDHAIAHDAADSQLRVDLIVLRLDRLARTLEPHIIKGTPGVGSPPDPVTSATVTDLALGEVFVPANATYLPSAHEDWRVYTNLWSPAAPTDAGHAVPKAYADNLGLTTATANSIARRNASGRLVAATPSQPSELATKGYVDETANLISVQELGSADEVNIGTTGNLGIAMGTVERPTGWGTYDLVLHGRFEVQMKGADFLRWEVVPQIHMGTTWQNLSPTSAVGSVTHYDNTVGTYAYGETFVHGRFTGLVSATRTLRWYYSYSTAANIVTSNKVWVSTRRSMVVTLLRRS